jgi:hypothetical protein
MGSSDQTGLATRKGNRSHSNAQDEVIALTRRFEASHIVKCPSVS